MKNTIFNKIYNKVLENIETPVSDSDELDELDDRCYGKDLTDEKTRHHVCKDIQGIRLLLKDIEEHFGIDDEKYSTDDIDINDLHNFIVDKLNAGCCNPYTRHYIYNDMLSCDDATPSSIMNAFWLH